MSTQHQLTERWTELDNMALKETNTTVSGDLKTYDEFSHPELHQNPPPPSLTDRLSHQFGEMPVFPIGMIGFVSMAAYGQLTKRLPLPERWPLFGRLID